MRAFHRQTVKLNVGHLLSMHVFQFQNEQP